MLPSRPQALFKLRQWFQQCPLCPNSIHRSHVVFHWGCILVLFNLDQFLIFPYFYDLDLFKKYKLRTLSNVPQFGFDDVTSWFMRLVGIPLQWRSAPVPCNKLYNANFPVNFYLLEKIGSTRFLYSKVNKYVAVLNQSVICKCFVGKHFEAMQIQLILICGCCVL